MPAAGFFRQGRRKWQEADVRKGRRRKDRNGKNRKGRSLPLWEETEDPLMVKLNPKVPAIIAFFR
jgi:hypothetical protein